MMTPRSHASRKAADLAIKVLSGLFAMLALFLLGWILATVMQRGLMALNWDFFTQLPPGPGMEGGGLANAIVGTLLITGLATVLGVPIGMMTGIYLAEFGPLSRIAGPVRFVINVLMGTPSIIVGVFVYTFLVLPVGGFSGYAGAVALAILMLPVVARTSEDMLALVPNTLRESALALGAPRWKVTLGVVFRAARTGLITGVILAVARVSGETAPLLFTALNSPYWMDSVNQPTANLTVTIFQYAMSPYPNWQSMAWGASLLITMFVLAGMLATRFLLRTRKTGR
jgi:phosphate transport system permease protein